MLRRAQNSLAINGPLYRASDEVGAAIHRPAELLGHPHHLWCPPRVSPIGRLSYVNSIRPEAALPSMPGQSTFEVVEEDDGSFAVVWAAPCRRASA